MCVCVCVGRVCRRLQFHTEPPYAGMEGYFSISISRVIAANVWKLGKRVKGKTILTYSNLLFAAVTLGWFPDKGCAGPGLIENMGKKRG